MKCKRNEVGNSKAGLAHKCEYIKAQFKAENGERFGCCCLDTKKKVYIWTWLKNL